MESRPDVSVVEGEYWLEVGDLDATETPLVTAVSFRPLRPGCGVIVTPLGRAVPTNFKGLSNLHFVGVQLGPPQTVAQLIRITVGDDAAGCP